MKTAKIKVSIVTNEFSPTEKEEMWDLYQNYYDYSKEYFMERIEKNNYFSLYKEEEKIIGFTGLRINRTEIKGKKRLLIYFGQTIIEPGYRGKSLIPATGAKLCLKYLPELLYSKIYFWADCLTCKAYLVFAKTLQEYYPSYKKNRSSDAKAVIDFIGQTHYADTYCPDTGTVKKDTLVVNDPNILIPLKYRQDPDVNFYVNANPLFMEGHGLIALGPVNFNNFRILMKRLLKRALGIPHQSKKASPVSKRVPQQTRKLF